MKNIKGFTLSEVLICLVIIGIIAAITVPVINNYYMKKDLHSRFLKVYGSLNNVARKFYADENISFTEYVYEHGQYSAIPALAKYINTNSTVSNDTWASTDENKDNNFHSLKTLNGGPGFRLCDVTGVISDISGAMYLFNDPPGKGENGPMICVDTNGAKGPNKYGYDYFIFIFTLDNEVIPMGMEHKSNSKVISGYGNFFVKGPEYCDKKSDWEHNESCAYYALTDKSPLNEKQSYWNDFL